MKDGRVKDGRKVIHVRESHVEGVMIFSCATIWNFLSRKCQGFMKVAPYIMTEQLYI